MAAKKKDLVAIEGGREPLSFDEQMIRIAGNPAIPVPRLKEISELRRQLRMDDAIEAYWNAMVACQEEMRPIEANANNPQTKSKYATHYAVDKALRPIYSKYGFALSFNTADCPVPDHIRVLCYCAKGLYVHTYQHDVAVDPKGARGGDVMTKTHAGGSALSYGKRYIELMIFNVTIGDPGAPADDDGNAAGGLVAISEAQREELIALAEQGGADKEKFCEVMKVASIADIPLKRFDEARNQLLRKIKAKRAADPAIAAAKKTADRYIPENGQ